MELSDPEPLSYIRLNDSVYQEEALICRCRAILRGIREHVPGVQIFVLSYYPVNLEAGRRGGMSPEIFENRTNRRILEANRAVEKMAEEEGVSCLDVNAGLFDGNGALREE